ncbi:MAG: hypothetical protein ACTHNW_09510, partial [Mucilaginibacter sp.]
QEEYRPTKISSTTPPDLTIRVPQNLFYFWPLGLKQAFLVLSRHLPLQRPAASSQIGAVIFSLFFISGFLLSFGVELKKY